MKLAVSLICAASIVPIQSQLLGKGEVLELYNTYCMACHGANLEGGLGSSLLDKGAWKNVGKDTTFLDYVKNGNLSMGMPPFGAALNDPQIRSLEIFVDEKINQASKESRPELDETGTFSSESHDFRIETVVEGVDTPWSMAFISENHMLITQRSGRLRVFKDGKLLPSVKGTPEIWASGQGGLLEVALHPNYAENGWVYLTIAHVLDASAEEPKAMTRVLRGRIKDLSWVDEEVIWETKPEFYRTGGRHFGSRLVFKDGYLFISIGERGFKDEAQDLSKPNGKIHRIFDDGRVPDDNPFVDQPNAYPSIWTYGNRNPQGLDLHPLTGQIWESEHGPRGGDEINVIERGLNYGWPVVSFGMNYNGKPMVESSSAPGMEQPKLHWTPSIAVCGIDFYEGDQFPEWKYNLFAGGLSSKELHRLVVEGDRVVKSELILSGLGRVRDIASGPDGFLYLALNQKNRIVRLVPAK